MLPKAQRLNLKRDFARLTQRGQRFQNPTMQLMVVYARPFAVGIAVGIRVVPQAVDRNRIRRLITQGVQELLPQLPKEVQLLFIVQKNCANWTKDQVKEVVSEICQRARLLPDKKNIL